jgi:methylated-DNA-[protein]-cysteine S-methyltransferase
LARAVAARTGRVDELVETLAARTRSEALVDTVYRTLETPIGTLLVAATPIGLVRLALPTEDHDAVIGELAGSVGARVLRAARPLDRAARALDAYFTGQRRSFDLPLDLRLARGFRREVVRSLTTIGYGTTRNYTEVAARVGHPGAARAVGSACATNPVPLVLPCHRVVRADGAPGDYRGGAELKVALLAFEASGGRPEALSHRPGR